MLMSKAFDTLRRASKIVVFLGMVCGFLVMGFGIHFTTKDIVKRRKAFTASVSFWSRLLLKLFNVKVNLVGFPKDDRNHLVISNHLGFFDDFIIAGHMPTMFVTSVELREAPVLGLLSEFAGCVYVEARNASNISNEMKDIESALNQGFNVVLYPEAKTTNGERVIPFKKTLLMSCAQTEANLLPTVLNFRYVNGEPMSDKWRDIVFWYKKTPLLGVLWNASAIRSCIVDWEYIKEIKVDAVSDRREVALLAQTLVEEKYVKIPLPVEFRGDSGALQI